ncbi:MAG: Uma2 family endonuclease [Pseudomonadota bacterium]|nr:Uma2 family endonuclease [Pseudomonadota bacterium]
MSSPEALPRMSPDEYLLYERDQPVRHELVDGYLYAMTGATDRHEEIALNLAAALRIHLRGTTCRAYKGDLKIRVADDFYYPDVFVRCGEAPGDPYFKTDPVMIAEVLSPGTQRYDRGDKRLAYFSLSTLQEYVLISQDRLQVEVYRRSAPGGAERLENAADVLRLQSVDLSIALSELYE